MFVKHCRVEVYLLEIKLGEVSNLEKIINKSMSRADTIGKALLTVFVHVTYMYLWVHFVNGYSGLSHPLTYDFFVNKLDQKQDNFNFAWKSREGDFSGNKVGFRSTSQGLMSTGDFRIGSSEQLCRVLSIKKHVLNDINTIYISYINL